MTKWSFFALYLILFLMSGCSLSVSISDTEKSTLNSKTPNVPVIDAPLILAPTSPQLIVSDTTLFSATGGKPPYAYSIKSGNGSIDPITGLYQAPSIAGSDTVQVIDSEGNFFDFVIEYFQALMLSDEEVIAGESVQLSATGGAGSPHTFSSINAYTTVAGLFNTSMTESASIQQISVVDRLGFSQNAQVRIRSFEKKDEFRQDSTSALGNAFANKMAEDSLGHLYAVGAAMEKGNSLWVVRKSTTKGNSWITVDTFSLGGMYGGANSIFIDLLDRIWVVGYSSSGNSAEHWIVRRSVDQGATWINIDDFQLDLTGANIAKDIKIDSLGNIFVVGHAYDGISDQCIIRKSTNGGLNWTRVEFQFFSGFYCDLNEIVLSGTTQYIIGYSGNSSSGDTWFVKKSNDLGVTWTTIDTYSVVASNPTKPSGIVINSLGHIFVVGSYMDASYDYHWVVRKTSDSGVTWSTVNNYAYTASYSSFGNGIAIDASQNIWTIGSGMNASYDEFWIVRKSTDGGTTWSTIDTFTLGSGLDGSGNGILFTRDGDILTLGGPKDLALTLHWVVRKSTNDGVSWSTVDDYNYLKGRGGSGVATISDSTDNLFSLGSAKDTASRVSWLLRKSLDHGASWSTVMNFTSNASYDSYAIDMAINSSNHLFVIGKGGGPSVTDTWIVRRSTDSGVSWSTVDVFAGGTGFDRVPADIEVNASGAIFVTGMYQDGGYISHWVTRRSTDNGNSWTTVDDYSRVVGAGSEASGISIAPNGNIFVVGTGNDSNGDGHWIVRRSTDAGATWATIDDFIDIPALWQSPNAITVDSLGHIYAVGLSVTGSMRHQWLVRKSTDGGSTWSIVDRYQFTSSDDASAWSVTSDSSGRILVGGQSNESIRGYSLIRTSRDDGLTWTNVVKQLKDPGDNLRILNIVPCLSGQICFSGSGSASPQLAEGMQSFLLSP